MPKPWDRPLTCRVALSTILAEELDVPILLRVTRRAIQHRLLRGDARMAGRKVARGLVLVDPVEELFPHRLVFGIRPAVGFQLAEADLGQRQVIHVGGTSVNALVLAVALPTTAHVGVERGRLAL